MTWLRYATRLALLPEDFEKFCSDTPTPGSQCHLHYVTMKNRLALAIALTVAVFSFLNLSS
jgi:hypothetical protein